MSKLTTNGFSQTRHPRLSRHRSTARKSPKQKLTPQNRYVDKAASHTASVYKPSSFFQALLGGGKSLLVFTIAVLKQPFASAFNLGGGNGTNCTSLSANVTGGSVNQVFPPTGCVPSSCNIAIDIEVDSPVLVVQSESYELDFTVRSPIGDTETDGPFSMTLLNQTADNHITARLGMSFCISNCPLVKLQPQLQKT